ncbi:MAG: diguanylate cyclase [Acidimicrobiales bacterium]|nr:diguanylate cyclase [Acidimicrobiales bacterium]MCB9371800.1 diguanylate cyclase [Microthrixaceae bacterium]
MAALRRSLAGAVDLVECAQRCCDHLVARGFELPSLYMRRSGRLRRFASNGYWQVLDGFPEASGVIAATVRSGRARLVEVDTCAEYLRAAPAVVAEACVPIRLHGEVVGALNVESTAPFGDGVLAEIAAVVECFAERAEALGGVAAPSGWVLLADNAVRISRADDEDDVVDTALAVATELSGSPSGLVALCRSDEIEVTRAVGPLSGPLRELGRASLAEIATWVDGPLSCYTVGEPAGQGFTDDDSLRTAGIHSLIVVSLAAGDERLGVLLVADDRATLPDPALVEQLELLATLVAGALVRTRAMDELVALSHRDPLTGLGHQRAFQARLADLEAGGFTGTALLSIDVDHFKAVNDAGGHQAGDRLLRRLARTLARELRSGDDLFRVGGDEFAAVVVGVAHPPRALEVAERMRRAARSTGVSVSIGVATGTGEGLDRDELFRRADDALYRAKRRGRDTAVLWEPPLPSVAPTGTLVR